MALNSYQEPLLTPEQVARYLGISVNTLYNMRGEGRGPTAYKYGPTNSPVRYRQADVDRWLEQVREVGE